ncbi:MAG: c-type cytochrome biogenesis protein CcmI [Alphaproteobacteria bacterium]|jgi:cytochrome c-type biogenesis protein CcmH|nr:c-type cytochrome biogenesis protein CcmI [Alphaproteobacteria bacterium]
MIWFAFSALTLAALAFLLIPLSRTRDTARDRAEADLGVYRAQLAELEAEVARGLLAPAEAEAARLEIQRRLLKADAAGAERQAGGSPRLALATIIVIAVVVPLFATLLYLRLGNPSMPGQPLDQVARDRAAAAEQQLAQVTNIVDRLRQRLIEQPGDLRGWLLLGRTLMALQRYPEAVTAYEAAARLDAQDATAQTGYGEALTMTAEGSVTPAAAGAFARAVAIDPKAPTARYYLGLAKFQNGDAAGAYDDWLALAREAPADAGYLAMLKERLAVVGRTIGRDPGAALAQAAPGPSSEQMQAAAGMTEQDRAAMIRSMVDNLAAKLAAQPDDFDGWMRLARARTVLRELPETRAALDQALRLRPADPDALFLAGQAAAAGGDKPSALDHWKRLLALLPAGSDDARAVEAAIARLEKS